MKDGSDAVADWPILNALVNARMAQAGSASMAEVELVSVTVPMPEW